MKIISKRLLLISFTSLIGILIILFGCFFFPDLLPYQGPDWQGITIGVSTQDDVLSILGKPSKTHRGILTTTLFYEKNGASKGVHLIKIRFGVVQEVEEDTLINSDVTYLKSLIEEYKRPEMVEWSYEGPDSRTVVFQNDGILANVIATPLNEAIITKMIYYKPLPAVVARIRFLNILPFYDPYTKSDVIGLKDPWFGTSDSCRHRCY